MYEKRGNIRFYFFYDATGNLAGFNYFSSDTSAGTTFYTTTNSQGDVIGVYNSGGGLIATYEYDAWGKLISLKNNSGIEISQTSRHVAALNPIRYRGYYYDSESDLYYIASRYYDANTGRFINSDTPEILTVNLTSVLDKSLFSYCDNNPTSRKDVSGTVWETVFDVVSLGFSVAEVIANPYSVSAWASVVGDTIDLIPFVTGVGEVTRGIRLVDKLGNSFEIVKALDFTEDAKKTIRKLDSVEGFTKSSRVDGIKIHSGYKKGAGFEPMHKEYKKVSGIRPDYFDGKTVFELKPFNPRAAKAGVKQLKNYFEKLGGKVVARLEFY